MIYPCWDEEGRRIDPPRLDIDGWTNDEELWANYVPDRVCAAVEAVAGFLTEEEGERLKALIDAGRKSGSQPMIS